LNYGFFDIEIWLKISFDEIAERCSVNRIFFIVFYLDEFNRVQEKECIGDEFVEGEQNE